MQDYRIDRILGGCWIFTASFAGLVFGSLIVTALKSLLDITLSDDNALLIVYGCSGFLMLGAILIKVIDEHRLTWSIFGAERQKRRRKEVAALLLINLLLTVIFTLLYRL